MLLPQKIVPKNLHIDRSPEQVRTSRPSTTRDATQRPINNVTPACQKVPEINWCGM